MLGRINSEATETNADQICQVLGNALLHILRLRIQVSKAIKPPIVKLKWILPRAEGPLTMEIHSLVSSGWILAPWDQPGVLIELISPIVRAHIGAIGALLASPSRTPVIVAIPVLQ